MSMRSTLPSILADETIFSWCSACHLMMCGTSSAKTGVALLGGGHASRQHDLPVSLGRLPLLDGARYEQALHMARRHTVAGYYLPFLAEGVQEDIARRIQTGTDRFWRRLCSGMSRTRPASHPLKWCADCVVDDQETVGRAYWHADHQFPTVLTCRRHDGPLLQRRHTNNWLLPRPHDSGDMQRVARPASEIDTLAEVSSKLRQICVVNTESIRRSALVRLQTLGVIHSIRKARHDRIERWFEGTEMSSRLRSLDSELSKLCCGDWIPDLLWRRKLAVATHWTVLWAALDWDSPRSGAMAFEDAANGRPVAPDSQALLFPDAIPVSGRAPDVVQEAFATGDSYAEVMRLLNATRGDVVRWLEFDPQLREEWRQRMRDGRQAQCVARIRNYVADHPEARRQDIESECAGELRWLREHAPSLARVLYKSMPGRLLMQPSLFD
ncbi:hypothetical protein J2X16_004016 [Pelomonas aquatica]|uniref:TniQ domain-containing protein n=1 Tax=Pelomonas aquatica TaxID=431058 RepID=A0ABU1ZDF8_9BURK|nr:hypothetical protein [Pelomonas aquatica]